MPSKNRAPHQAIVHSAGSRPLHVHIDALARPDPADCELPQWKREAYSPACRTGFGDDFHAAIPLPVGFAVRPVNMPALGIDTNMPVWHGSPLWRDSHFPVVTAPGRRMIHQGFGL